jgi:phosphoribosylamine--glycine ligase / phosphoribosylformylglycinamidine cyclo-ligase
MLFTGVMLTASGPKVLEYNVRFGDPETQAMIPLLRKETDLAEIMVACTEGRLDQVEIEVSSGFCANVVITAGGYPEGYAKGDVVEFGPIPESGSMSLPCIIFLVVTFHWAQE